MPNPALVSPQSAVNPLATLPQPPPTLPLWARALYYIAETIAIGVGFQKFDWGKSILPGGGGTTGTDVQTWRRFSFKWQDTASGDTADDQYFTIDVANITNGDIDSTWTQADYDTVVGVFATMVAQMAPLVIPRMWCESVSAYVMAFNPYGNPKPFAQSGSPEITVPIGVTGSAGGNAAPQTSCTVTEETPSRKNWGRFYLPAVGGGAFDTAGRISNANVDALAQNVHDQYETLMGAQFFPVVPVTSVDKQPIRALQTVSGIRVDNVADVHRSRRHKRQTHRAILPLPTQAAQQPA